MSNKRVKQKLEELFGKQCFIEKLELRKDDKNYTANNQLSKMRKLTYHHIVEKKDGGQATVENGAVLSEENHIWFNKQSKVKQNEINNKFQEYKISCLLGKLEKKGLVIEQYEEIEKNEEFIEIPLEKNIKEEDYGLYR